LVTVFDANELELILCGLPTIDMNDWRAHTNYSGLFETQSPSSPVIQWFWDVVSNDFDGEMKALVAIRHGHIGCTESWLFRVARY
jgi:HECT-domain (ubiquitin-transferase)